MAEINTELEKGKETNSNYGDIFFKLDFQESSVSEYVRGHCGLSEGVSEAKPLNFTNAEQQSVMVELIDTLLKSDLQNMNLNIACAIAGNVLRESSFNFTAVNSYSKAYGLCQWLGPRLNGENGLKAYCNNNSLAYDTSKGQIQFLIHELKTSEKSAYKATVEQRNNLGQCALTFCRRFERPAPKDCIGRDKNALSVYTSYNKIKNGG